MTNYQPNMIPDFLNRYQIPGQGLAMIIDSK